MGKKRNMFNCFSLTEVILQPLCNAVCMLIILTSS